MTIDWRGYINIGQPDLREVIRAAYDLSAPQGLGILHYRDGGLSDEHRAWSKIHRAPPRPDRWKERSRFFPGVAAAMADQWGDLETIREHLPPRQGSLFEEVA